MDYSIVDAAGAERRRTSRLYDDACTRTNDAGVRGVQGEQYAAIWTAERIAGIRYDIAVRADRAVHLHHTPTENLDAVRAAIETEAREAADRLTLPDDVAIHRAIEAYLTEWAAIVAAAEVLA